MKILTYTPIAVAISAASTASFITYAQQSIDTESVEKIVVTGSRIKGVDLEGTQPLVILSADDIKNSGASTISELMQQVSQTRGGEGSFTTTESGATSTSTPAGQAAASLRGLGPSSTLTLINGRRVAASSFASGTQNFVDINSIPLAAIESVEILATGASAIYGADAVAGVINYILKSDYEGAEINSSYSNSTASSDEGKFNLNLVWGAEIAGGNLTVFADHFSRNAFHANDRSTTSPPLLTNSYSYLPKNTPNIYYYSNRDGLEMANPNCQVPLVTTEFDETICPYYRNQDDQLNSELETTSLGFMFNRDFDEITWSTDFFYSNSKSSALSSPAPINQIDDSEGPWANETALDVFPTNTRDALLDDMYIDPFTTQAGQRLYGFQFDARFGTPRTIDVKTNAIRLVTSLAGTIDDWDWESALTVSRSESEQVAEAGIYNRYQYHAALAGELCSNGLIATYDGNNLNCESGQLLNMYNPFLSGDANNDAILAATQAKPTREGESTVYGWDGRITGELFEFNGNTVSAAFGAEIRKEEITDLPSENAQARADNEYLVDVFGFGSSVSSAQRTQWGAFAEFYAPLTDTLELQVAGRYDNYDDFGDTFNPKIGLTFRPIEELIIRGSWSTSFRAPSLTQAGVKLRTTTATYDCGANQAVADLYCEGFGDERSPNVLELGNTNLRAEESTAISFGVAFSPTTDTTITVDYWKFEHDDLVDTDMTGVLFSAIDDASLRHCGLVPNGQEGISYDPDLCLVTDNSGLTIEENGANLTEILYAWAVFDDPRYVELPLYRDHIIKLQNTGKQTVSGIDLAFNHIIMLDHGNVKFAVDATHYLQFDRNKAGSNQVEELIGTWRYPENIASARVSWSGDTFYASLTAEYTSSYEDDISGLRGREIDELLGLGVLDSNDERDVESWLTVRANMGYDFDKLNINLSIDNLLNEDAPIAYGSSRGFDSLNHNALGTTYRLSLSYRF